MDLIYRGMNHYLKKKPSGKKFHDPLAACCAIDPTIGEWAEVQIYYDHGVGEWGSRFVDRRTGTWIITEYDDGKFVEVLTMV